MVVAARPPAKQVYPAAISLRNIIVITTAHCSASLTTTWWILRSYIIPLVFCETPCVRAGAVLQVALREIHLVAAGVYGELAVYRARGGLRLRIKVGGVSRIPCHRNGARVAGVAVLPLAEGVAAVGRGRQGAALAVGIGSSACHATAAAGAHVGAYCVGLRRSRKRHVIAIARALAVYGVGAHMVGRLARQAGHVHRKRACACAAARMAAIRRRVRTRAPADAALRYRCAAVCRHVAAARGRGLRYVRHRARRHRRGANVLAGGEAHFVAVGCAGAVLRVGSHVVGRVG